MQMGLNGVSLAPAAKSKLGAKPTHGAKPLHDDQMVTNMRVALREIEKALVSEHAKYSSSHADTGYCYFVLMRSLRAANMARQARARRTHTPHDSHATAVGVQCLFRVPARGACRAANARHRLRFHPVGCVVCVVHAAVTAVRSPRTTLHPHASAFMRLAAETRLRGHGS
eukprot:651965-Pleurochrysis_carterae.AAC.1